MIWKAGYRAYARCTKIVFASTFFRTSEYHYRKREVLRTPHQPCSPRRTKGQPTLTDVKTTSTPLVACHKLGREQLLHARLLKPTLLTPFNTQQSATSFHQPWTPVDPPRSSPARISPAPSRRADPPRMPSKGR